MITIIKALKQVTGVELILMGVIICILIFAGGFVLLKFNRKRKSVVRYMLFALLVFELCDLIWLSYLFPKGQYLNRGLFGAGIFLIFPFLLTVLNIILTLINNQVCVNKE